MRGTQGHGGLFLFHLTLSSVRAGSARQGRNLDQLAQIEIGTSSPELDGAGWAAQ